MFIRHFKFVKIFLEAMHQLPFVSQKLCSFNLSTCENVEGIHM